LAVGKACRGSENNLHVLGYLDAAVIGRIETGQAHALIETELGGERILQELEAYETVKELYFNKE
jgi:hydrogenase maturation factor